MAHKKAQASTASQKSNRKGKRRGVKKYAGEVVKIGSIIVRQLGSVIKAGKNTGMGKDFTIFARKAGNVKYNNLSRGKKEASVE